jgi:hypothetical protein
MGRVPRPSTAQRHYQREFIEWLAAHRGRFGSRRVTAHRTLRYLDIRIDGLNPAMRIVLTSWNLGVHVYYKDSHIDIIFDCDIELRRDGDAWICSGCDWEKGPKPLPRFASIADLRVDHQFEQLLRWYQEKLDPARFIEYAVQRRHYSYARLCDTPQHAAGIDPDGTIHGHCPVWVTP